MLKINCKVGMKVTTSGDTMDRARSSSTCCQHEKEVGYLKVIAKNGNYTQVGYRHYSANFKYENIHPYELTKGGNY